MTKKTSLVFTLLLTYFALTGYSQQPLAMSFDKLPEDNKMVEKSIKLFDLILAGNLDEIKKKYPSKTVDYNEIEKSVKYFQDGVVVDTSYIEFYRGSGHTDMKFKVNCNEIESGLVYWLNVTSTGTSGSIRQFEYSVERDTKTLKIQELLDAVPPPKNE
jgi:hypothetical protein